MCQTKTIGEYLKEREINKEIDRQRTLIEDLCARLPYGVIVQAPRRISRKPLRVDNINHVGKKWYVYFENGKKTEIKYVKPYLRSMYDMSYNDKQAYHRECTNPGCKYGPFYDTPCSIKWLIAHHYDYQNMIRNDWAIQASDDIYNVNNI